MLVATSSCSSTFPGPDQAAEVARTLVEERLCACVNLVPAIRSIYRWQGAVHDERRDARDHQDDADRARRAARAARRAPPVRRAGGDRAWRWPMATRPTSRGSRTQRVPSPPRSASRASTEAGYGQSLRAGRVGLVGRTDAVGRATVATGRATSADDTGEARVRVEARRAHRRIDEAAEAHRHVRRAVARLSRTVRRAVRGGLASLAGAVVVAHLIVRAAAAAAAVAPCVPQSAGQY